MPGLFSGTALTLPIPRIEDSPDGVVEFFSNKASLNRKQKTFVYIHGWTDNGRITADGSAKSRLIFDRLNFLKLPDPSPEKPPSTRNPPEPLKPSMRLNRLASKEN